MYIVFHFSVCKMYLVYVHTPIVVLACSAIALQHKTYLVHVYTTNAASVQL